MAKDIAVYIEQREGVVEPVAFELISEARRLATGRDRVHVVGVLIGAHLSSAIEELKAYGLDRLLVAEDEAFALYQTELYTEVLTSVIKAEEPEILLIGATSIGRDLAPRCSAAVKTGLTADCTQLEMDEETGNLLMTRPAFGGNIMATIVCGNHRPQMATVRPGVMEVVKGAPECGVSVDRMDLSGMDLTSQVKILEAVKNVKDHVDIGSARVLVAGGRGVGSKEDFALLRKLADSLKGEVAASRAAVDEGWVEKAQQVGQTGTTVRPDLYIACGISGAIQHIAGMENAGYIVAVNKDPDAPIFEYADIGLVGDYKTIVPMLQKELESISN